MQVTVLMPVYNAERFLDDSIGSLLSQTIKDWKLICIDDGSTDSSLQILRKYEADNERIKVLVQENAGPAVARAKAIEFVDTEYVSILDSDDAYAPDYVELMLKRAEETNADSIVPDVEFGYGNTKKNSQSIQIKPPKRTNIDKRREASICHDHSLETTWMANDSYLLGQTILYRSQRFI